MERKVPPRDRAQDLCAEGLLTVPEVANFLRVSRATIYLMVGRGEFPVVKLGKRTLLPRAAVVRRAAEGLR